MREEKQIRIEFAESTFPEEFENPDAGDTVLSLVFLGFVIFYGVQVAESQRSAVYDILPFPGDPLCGCAAVRSPDGRQPGESTRPQIQRYSPRTEGRK